MFDTNVLGMLYTFQPFLAAMQAARKGKLVGIASVAGFRGLPGSGPYSASKAAAISYLESLRVEMRGKGVSRIDDLPGIRRHADDGAQSVSDAVPARARQGGGAHRKALSTRNRRFYVLPWQMAWTGKLLRMLPRPLYDAVFARAPRKPRAKT